MSKMKKQRKLLLRIFGYQSCGERSVSEEDYQVVQISFDNDVQSR